MNNRIVFLMAATALLLCKTALQAQIMIKAEPGKVLHIEEIQCIVVEKNDAIVVEAVLPTGTRLDQYKDVEISKNDTVFMVNGSRINSVKQLTDLYQNIPVGDEFKIGVRGRQGLRIISFVKADPGLFQNKKMMKVTVENEDGQVTKKVVDGSGKTWTGEEAEQMIEKMKTSRSDSDSGSVKIEIDETKP